MAPRRQRVPRGAHVGVALLLLGFSGELGLAPAATPSAPARPGPEAAPRSSNAVTTRLNELAEIGAYEAAESEFLRILPLVENTRLHRMTYNTLLKALANAGQVQRAEEIMEEMVLKRLEQNAKGYGKLIESAAKAGRPAIAEQWLRRMSESGTSPTAWSYGIICDAYAKVSDLQNCERCIADMRQAGFRPRDVEYLAVMSAAARAGDEAAAKSWFQKAQAAGIKPAVEHYHRLANAAAKSGSLVSARRWFETARGTQQLSKTDIACFGSVLIDAAARAANLPAAEAMADWLGSCQIPLSVPDFTSLILAAQNSGDDEKALEWLQRAKKEVGPSPEHYRCVASALAERGDVAAVNQLAKDAAAEGLEPASMLSCQITALSKAGNFEGVEALMASSLQAEEQLSAVVWKAAILAANRAGALELAEEWFKKAGKTVKGEDHVYNALLATYAEKGDLAAAKKHFQEMLDLGTRPGVGAYTLMVKAATKAGRRDEAEAYFQRCVQAGVQPNIVMFGTLVTAASDANDFEDAMKWLRSCTEMRLEPTAELQTAALSRASRHRNLEAAKSVFAQGQELGLSKDLKSYTCMMQAAAEKGDFETAEKWLQEAKKDGHKPDMVCHNILIGALARRGRMADAERWIDACEAEGLKPTAVTFNIMLNSALSWAEACRWWERRLQCGKPDANCYLKVIKAAARFQEDPLAGSEHWLYQATKEGVQLPLPAYVSLVQSAVKVQNITAAEYWFGQIKQVGLEPDAAACSTLLRGYCGSRLLDVEGACGCLARMEASGLKPTALDYNTVLQACAKKAPPEAAAAESLLRKMVTERQLQPDKETVAALQSVMGAAETQGLFHELGQDLERAVSFSHRFAGGASPAPRRSTPPQRTGRVPADPQRRNINLKVQAK